MMILLFGMISFVTNLAAPMGVVLKNQFQISNALGMLGNAANFIAYAIMGIPAGILLSKLGYKKTALIAVAIGFVGVGIQFLSGHTPQGQAFVVYICGALVAGFSMCLLNTVVNPMLNTLGGGGNKGGQLIQIGGSFNSLVGTITPMFVGALIGEVAKSQIANIFPVMYIAMGVFAVVFFVLLPIRLPEPGMEKINEPISQLMFGALKFRHFLLGAIGIFVYVGVEVGIPGTLNLFLTDLSKGMSMDPTIAGFVAGTYWFLMLIGRLVGSAVGGKVSSQALLATGSGIGLVLVLAAILSPAATQVTMPVLQTGATGGLSFGLTQVPISAMFLVLVGLCTSIMWGGIFNLAVEGLGKYLAAATGIFMVLVCGGGLLPLLQNWVADISTFMTSYWVVFAGLAYLLFYALIGSKNVNKDIEV
jgi:FHS family L-fucose permease-like MFS transporter